MSKNNVFKEMSPVEFGKFLGGVPCITSQIVYDYMGKNDNKIPRFSSVFKIVKEELVHYGYDYKKLTDLQKSDLEEMVRDVYIGLKEAGF